MLRTQKYLQDEDRLDKEAGLAEVPILAALAVVTAIGIGVYATTAGDETDPMMSATPQPTTNTFTSPIATASPIMTPTDQPSISQVQDNPDMYLGQTLTLEGEIDAMRQSQSFVLDQEGTLFGDEILVLMVNDTLATPSPDNQLNLFEDTDDVRVTGEVRRLVTAEIEEDFGLTLDQELSLDFEEELVIIANQITRINQANN